MPYGPVPAQYYPPPPGYGPRPPREASVDIKAFIPASYEHVKFNPTTIALVFGVGVAVVLVMQKKQSAGGK